MLELNERIKLLRKEKGLTQKQFADRILVTQPYLSRIESGKEFPNEKLLKLIALEFNVPTDWLENGTGAPIIQKDTFDYYDRGYEKELQEGLNEEIEELKKFLTEYNNGVVSTNVHSILLEMRLFLDSWNNETRALQTIVFEKIAGSIMEIFNQLQSLNPRIEKTEFKSMAWNCVSTLTNSLNDISYIFFNPNDFPPYKD